MKIQVKDASLEVEVSEDTDKPALLLWNGAGCNLRMWDTVIPLLTTNFKTIAFDVRGVGQSSPSEDSTLYTYEQYAEDVNLILNELEEKQVHIWSMAWGTRAAIAYCSLFPEKAISAVLSDASIDAADTEAQKAGAREAVTKQLALGISKFNKPEGWNVHQDNTSMMSAMTAIGKFDLSKVLDKLTMPVMVMTGDHDPNLSSSKKLVERLSNAKLVELKNVGHGSILQRPDLTTKEFLEFHKSL
mgnify:FL=1